jgi:TolA-binding protein
LKKIFILLLPVLFLCSCGVWDDFTTYFNLYYDTSDIFSQAEKLIKEQNIDIFSNEDIPLPGSAGQLLSKVIEKSSKILQFHPQSIYTENALMMLGKSFYYEKEYLKALRQFQELVKSKPKSGLILEANLWIGKSHLRLKQYDDALKTLVDVKNIAVDKGESDIFEEAYLEQIKYRVVTEDLDQAISLIIEFLTVSHNSSLNAKVSYQLGKLYYKRADYLNSITALQNVFKYSPSYDVTLDSKIELAKAFRKSGDPQRGLDLMKEMRKEVKYSDVYHRIDLEIGLCQVELKMIDDGIQTLMKIDTAYANTPSAGLARFELGKIYETRIPDYDSAYKYYTKASTSTSIADPLILQASGDLSQRFKKYQYIRSLVNDNRTQIKYIEKPDEFIKDSTANADSIKKQEDLLKESKALNQNDQGTGRNETGRYISPGNNTTTGIIQQTYRRPLLRPVMSLDSLKANLVKNEFDLGNLFFTVLNRPDSASWFYNDILNNYPDSKYEADVLYALGSYNETENNLSAADSIYNLIYDKFKTQKIVNAAATKLKKPLIDVEFDPAKQFYAEAESDMLKKDFNIALNKMLKISNTYPKSPIAPKALFASGWILENDLKLNDSAAVVYDTLQARYPKTVYALKIRPKLYAYKDEIQRIKTAVYDSLKKIELEKINKKKADSIAVVQKQKIVDSLANIKNPKVDSLGNIKKLKVDSLGNVNNKMVDSLKNVKTPNSGVKTDSLKVNALKPVVDSLNIKKNAPPDSLNKLLPEKPKK